MLVSSSCHWQPGAIDKLHAGNWRQWNQPPRHPLASADPGHDSIILDLESQVSAELCQNEAMAAMVFDAFGWMIRMFEYGWIWMNNGWMISWYNLERSNQQQTAGLYECSKLLYGGVEFRGVILRQAEQLSLARRHTGTLHSFAKEDQTISNFFWFLQPKHSPADVEGPHHCLNHKDSGKE